MEEEGAHQEGVSRLRDAEVCRKFPSKSLDFTLSESPTAMGHGKYLKGAVRGVRRIQMDSNGQHLLQDPGRRLNMGNSVFPAPGTESREFNVLADRNRDVLVPGDQPVRLGGFVKIQSADGSGFAGQMRSNQSQYRLGLSKVPQ